MNDASSSAESVLRDHLQICHDLHELLLEENRVLRTTSAPPPEDLLRRKRDFLPRLDASLERLRALSSEGRRYSPAEEAAVQDGRRKLMQLLMLDRENERLLLKASLPPRLKAAYAPVIPGQVARAYQQHAGKEKPDTPPVREDGA